MKRIINIVQRELHLWTKRPIYLVGSLGVMLATAVFFLTFFGKGLPEDIPIGVVDRDNSSMLPLKRTKSSSGKIIYKTPQQFSRQFKNTSFKLLLFIIL